MELSHSKCSYFSLLSTLHKTCQGDKSYFFVSKRQRLEEWEGLVLTRKYSPYRNNRLGNLAIATWDILRLREGGEEVTR